ncbi:hypothetical protein OG21DRAFT_1196424 [Imleria badia]|nr:hypothetical protein OG21DRAFT_1196424 [Imleria badia]
MPKSPQDVYARHLISPRGYPLWTPEPSHQFVVYRRDGLKIGDVGVVIPEDGCFDVFFNICLPQDHHFHRATGVPDNFKRIELSDTDIRTVVSAENPGRIIANSSVRSVRTIERPADSSSERTRPSGLEYEFTLSSSEGALLILPEGAERHDLRNHHRFLEVATQHGADWYRFAEEKVGQIIDNDSLYLITGLHKTRSWSVAAFEKTAGTAEHSAQFRVSQSGSDSIAATYTWDTTRALDWRVGPVDNYGLANQSVFIRGFKVALRTGIFGTKWISVKADAPSTRPNPARSLGAVGGDSLFAYVFSSTGKTTQSSGSGVQDEVAANSALDDARNEIQNSGALAVGEHVVIQRIPEASQAFHPSDIINRYLLDKEPSANIAITHDDDWITILEENLLQPEDLVQEGRLETLVSQKYDTISDEGAVYLRSRSGSGTFNADDADSTMEGREIHSEERNATVIDTVQVRERGFSSTRRSSVELLPVPDLSHQRIFPGQGATGSTYNITHTTSPMQEAQARIVADIRQTLNLNNYQQGLPPRSTVATNETSRAPDLPRPHCSELDHPASLADSNSIGATEAPVCRR